MGTSHIHFSFKFLCPTNIYISEKGSLFQVNFYEMSDITSFLLGNLDSVCREATLLFLALQLVNPRVSGPSWSCEGIMIWERTWVWKSGVLGS